MEEIYKGIFRCHLSIDADDEGVRSANVFLIPSADGARHLLIDAGFRTEESLRIVDAAMREKGMRYADTDVFITHRHHDHAGLCGVLQARGARIFMNGREERHPYDCLAYRPGAETERAQEDILKSVGVSREMTPELFEKFQFVNEAWAKKDRWFLSLPGFPYTDIEEGWTFRAGGFVLETLPLKGHTFGQMGLWDRKKKILFTADQVIDGVSPIVATTYQGEKLLEAYMDSLEWLENVCGDFTVIPSHGEEIQDLSGAVRQTLASYRRKIDGTRKIVQAARRPVTVREVAFLAYGMTENVTSSRDLMKIKMVLTKTHSLLEYLSDRGSVRCLERDGVYYFAT